MIRGLLQGFLAAGLLASVAISNATFGEPMGGWVATDGERPVSRPSAVPVWRDAYGIRFPGCGPERVLGDVVWVTQTGELERLSFDRAWRLVHNLNRADDGWVVGWCK